MLYEVITTFPVATREHYTFVGWGTSKDMPKPGEPASVNYSTTGNWMSNVSVLYAQWKPQEFKILV